MNYKLAKELKDAGYSQDKIKLPDGVFDIPETLVYLPNLSELIEACGEEFYSLTKNPLTPKLWDACRIKDSSGARRTILAHTPEEAVAGLWLALNENEDT